MSPHFGLGRGVVVAIALCSPSIGNAQTRSCPPGSYGVEEPNGVVCYPWRVCQPGTHVVSWGTNVADRICQDCASGTYTNAPNMLACLPYNNCPAGTYMSDDPTPWGGRTCTPCQTTVTFTDSVNRYQCELVRDCPPGTYVSRLPSRASNRECTVCPPGTLSRDVNQHRCTPTALCPSGTYETSIGTPTSERLCSPREVECVTPFVEVAPVTATSDRRCEEDRCLRPGQYAHCPFDTPECSYVS